MDSSCVYRTYPPSEWLWCLARINYSQQMLPILRILPVGGVFLAIMILVLALDPPGGSRPSLTPAVMPARGALIQGAEHPEWRQFLILAATRRADELAHLHELPGSPGRTGRALDPPKVAGLPADRSNADPDDETGTITEAPGATIPVDIGETSSFELPVTQSEDKPPVIKTPERGKPKQESRKKGAHRAPRAKAPGNPPAQFNLIESLFGGTRTPQPATGSAQISAPAIVNSNPH